MNESEYVTKLRISHLEQLAQQRHADAVRLRYQRDELLKALREILNPANDTALELSKWGAYNLLQKYDEEDA